MEEEVKVTEGAEGSEAVEPEKVTLKQKAKNMLARLPKWKTPPPGKSMNLKEWLLYIIGGTGAMGVTGLMIFITLQQAVYIAAARSIDVNAVAMIGVITNVVAIVTTPFVSWLIDNTNTKFGKFRPYLFILPIPIVLTFVGIGQVINIENDMIMLVSFTILFNVLNFFIRLYTIAFTSIAQVISPSMEERTEIMSIGTFFTSLGPTITGFLFPVLANAMYSKVNAEGVITTSGVNTVGPYQWLLPVMVSVFLLLGVVLAFGVKERIVVSKKFKQKQNFVEGCKKTVKNKYFWILNISAVFNIMKMFVAVTFPLWYINYIIMPELSQQGLVDLANTAQSLIMMLIGDASIPGMLFAPYFINKFGKKKIILVSNFAIAICMIPLLFVNNAWVHLVFIYIMSIAAGFHIVTTPACQTEVNDYQQYKTGDRIEGFLTQFGSIFTIAVGIGTAFIAPAVYKSFGYVNDTSVLYNPDTVFGIVRVMAGISIACAILSALPYFFWDLTEKKHRNIMEVLEIRARYEDGLIDEPTKEELEERAMKGELGIITQMLADMGLNPDGTPMEQVASQEQNTEEGVEPTAESATDSESEPTSESEPEEQAEVTGESAEVEQDPPFEQN